MAKGRNTALKRLLHHEATAGGLLALAAFLAIAVSNSRFAEFYQHVLEWPVIIGVGPMTLNKSLEHFINDGLMTVFFFLVGLEIKREFLEGNLSERSQVILPAVAALGGMLVPALIYAKFNAGMPTIAGWAIPAATDIAFALGALALVSSRMPVSLKVFLLTLATLDDLGAIVIIALFYTANISLLSLGLAGGCLALLVIANRLKLDRMGPYILIGLIMWLCVLNSGVHATIAGVLLAFTIPLRRRDGSPLAPVLEQNLHPYVNFVILPIFAFANAGIPFAGFSLNTLTEAVPLGIAAGLFVGKPLGILLAVAICVGLRIANLPAGSGWGHMIGVGCLAGIGFTMSLFIGGLAFGDPIMMDEVRIGVILGSMLSIVLGLTVLRVIPRVAPLPP